MAINDWEKEKKENSAAWHTATTQAEKDRLQQRNIDLQRQIDSAQGTTSSFNSGTGTWTTKPAGGVATSATSYSGSKATGTDDYGNTDWSTLINNTINSGGDPSVVSYYLNQRMGKISQDGALAQYANDDTTQRALQYITGSTNQQAPQYPYQMDQRSFMNQYNQISEAERAAIDAYIKQSVNGLEAQKAGVNQSAEQAARQAYISYMQSQSTLPQALAASGYSGGMADSQRIALETGLQNNQKDILLNRDNTLNGINTAIENAKLEGSIQGARAQADIGRDALSAWQNYMSQQNAYANQDFWTKYGYDFQGGQADLNRQHQTGERLGSQQWQSGENQANRDYTSTTTAAQQAHNAAMDLIFRGIMPGADLLAAAGINGQDAQRYVADVLAGSTGTRGTGGTGGNSSVPGDNNKPPNGTDGISQDQYDAAVTRFEKGDYSPDVINVMLAAGETPDTIARGGGFSSDETALGFGPISQTYLAQLVSNGQVIAVNIGGRLFYKRVNTLPGGGGLGTLGR